MRVRKKLKREKTLANLKVKSNNSLQIKNHGQSQEQEDK